MDDEAFHRSVLSLASKVRQSGFAPDGLVALARGGWIPARLLATPLGVKRLYSYGLAYEDRERTKLAIYSEPSPSLRNLKLLLVEDYLETGKSMKFVAQRLLEKGNDVKTVALGYKAETVIVPTYSLGQVDGIPSLPWD